MMPPFVSSGYKFGMEQTQTKERPYFLSGLYWSCGGSRTSSRALREGVNQLQHYKQFYGNIKIYINIKNGEYKN